MNRSDIESIDLVLPESSVTVLSRTSERLRPLRFLIAGALSVPVNMAARVLLSQFLSFDLAVVGAHLCGMLTAYTLNKLFVFDESGRHVHSEFLRFALVNLVSVAQTWVVSITMLNLVLPTFGVTSHTELISHFTGLASTAITSYFGHKIYSFAKVQA